MYYHQNAIQQSVIHNENSNLTTFISNVFKIKMNCINVYFKFYDFWTFQDFVFLYSDVNSNNSKQIVKHLANIVKYVFVDITVILAKKLTTCYEMFKN